MTNSQIVQNIVRISAAFALFGVGVLTITVANWFAGSL